MRAGRSGSHVGLQSLAEGGVALSPEPRGGAGEDKGSARLSRGGRPGGRGGRAQGAGRSCSCQAGREQSCG